MPQWMLGGGIISLYKAANMLRASSRQQQPSDMRFQAAMHQIGELKSQLKEVEERNSELRQRNQELEQQIQQQLNSQQENRRSASRHRDASVNEDDSYSVQELRYKLIYLERKLEETEAEHDIQFREQKSKYKSMQERADRYERNSHFYRSTSFRFLLQQLEYIKQIEQLFPKGPPNGLKAALGLVQSMKNQALQFHRTLVKNTSDRPIDSAQKSITLNNSNQRNLSESNNTESKHQAEDGTLTGPLVTDLSKTLKSMDQENASLHERIRFLEAEVNANNKLSTKVQKAFSLVRQYQGAVKKLHHQLHRTREQLDSKEHENLEAKATIRDLQNILYSRDVENQEAAEHANLERPSRKKHYAYLIHSSNRNLYSILPSSRHSVVSYPEKGNGHSHSGGLNKDAVEEMTDEEVNSSAKRASETEMSKNEGRNERHGRLSTLRRGYRSDTSDENMNISRLVATGGRESDSNGSGSDERKTQTPSSIESGNSAPEDTQALIDDIQTLLHEFDHEALNSDTYDTHTTSQSPSTQ
eukprot:gb/GECG01001154.1/.p1 GENE.gb/GECG01001154.1/~~gb/GECG01001154.1/.p1  ORF type:complete len:529 (+),score=94.44 gb/GECG01001154.1/:1-1587(+)